MAEPRRVQPLSLRGLTPHDPGPMPTLIWVDPNDLYVDESYQRGLSEAGRRLIRKIVNEFDWRRFKPPSVVETDEGYRVIDGQHSAIAAVTHPAINLVPVLLHAGADLREQAGAFIAINRDRLNVTKNQLHHAALVAGDPAALAVDAACRAAGVRVLRAPPAEGHYAPGDLMAVGTAERVLRARGAPALTQILTMLSSRAPVTAQEIRALELLMFDPDFRADFDPAVVAPIVAASSDYDRREAEAIAAVHEKPLYRALAIVWYRRVPRRAIKPQLVKGSP